MHVCICKRGVCVLSAWIVQCDPYLINLSGLILSNFIKNLRTSSSIILSLLHTLHCCPYVFYTLKHHQFHSTVLSQYDLS